jgi:hypothetical protein
VLVDIKTSAMASNIDNGFARFWGFHVDVMPQAIEIMHLYLKNIQLFVDLDLPQNMPREELLTLTTNLWIQILHDQNTCMHDYTNLVCT